MKASHKKHTQIVGCQPIELNPGQFIFGRKASSEETGLSEQETRTAVTLLKNLGNVTIKSTNKYSLAIVVNWACYPSGQKNHPAIHY